MANETLSYAEQLAQLQAEYCHELPSRLQQIQDAWSNYRSNNWQIADLKILHHYVHRIAGSASSFGFAQLSTSARIIEQKLKQSIETTGAPTKELQKSLNKRISSLQQHLKQSPSKAKLADKINRAEQKQSQQRLVYMLEDDQPYAKDLALQISRYGYRVETFADTSSILAAIRKQIPDLYIVDIVIDDKDLGGTEFVTKIRQQKTSVVPVIIHSVRTDFDARLSAVRAGADAYMVKPLDIDALLDKVDDILGRKPKRPYQILLVDDDVNLANHYALVLRQAGMQVEIVNQPQQVLASMDENVPDIILMDLYMPVCTGIDLAKVIRQQKQFDAIPIIFLSTESDADRQLFAMRMGGDEFLTKPITDKHLQIAVSVRAERARRLSALTMQDSLTGLLNHACLKEQLVNSVSRAQRSGQTFAFAMIDIDHFKTINDEYGHMMGDHVIKSMAKLLSKRLRINDIIGRYGGEEFAVILDNCNQEHAFALIDSIREDFARIVFGKQQAFNVTFSAGIAMYPDYMDAEAINQAADEALYRAKGDGRNKVVIQHSTD